MDDDDYSPEVIEAMEKTTVKEGAIAFDAAGRAALGSLVALLLRGVFRCL